MYRIKIRNSNQFTTSNKETFNKYRARQEKARDIDGQQYTFLIYDTDKKKMYK